MSGATLTVVRLDAGRKPSAAWRRDLADVLLAAAALLALALASLL